MTFATGSYDEVCARAAAEGRLVVLDFTASWCAPCRAMEQSVWPDPRVRAWLEAHALALRVDIDAEKEIATRFAIRSVPSIVVLRGEAVLDRRSGNASAAALVGWLEGLLAGRTWIDELREAASRNDVRARHDLGRTLAERGELDGALEELVWVWQNALAIQPAYVGVRHSFLVEELRGLAARHAPARERIERLRDDAAAAVATGTVNRAALQEWASLSRASGDASAILRWFDALGGAVPDGLDVGAMQRMFGPLLDTAERRAALGRMVPGPTQVLAEAEAMRARVRAMPDLPGMNSARLAASMFQKQIAEARASYVAAGREEDVRALDEAEREANERG